MREKDKTGKPVNTDLETELLAGIEAIPDGFILYDREDRIIAFNGEQRALFPSVGNTLKLGNKFEDLLRAQVDSGQIDAAIGREDEWIESRKRAHKNPKEPYVQKFADGRTIRLTETFTATGGTVAIRTDITELAANQNALEQSNAQYEALLELNPDAVIVQVNGIIKYANSAAVRIFGARSHEDLIGTDGLVLAHPDYQDRVFDRRSQIMNQGATFTAITTRHVRLDGSAFDSEISAGPVSWGKEKGTMNIIRDVTRRVEAERILAQEQERFRDLTHATSDWYWESDANFRFTYISSNIVDSGLLNAEEYIGKSQRDILGDEDFEAQESLREFERMIKTQESFRDVIYWRYVENTDQKIWIRTSGIPFYDKEENFEGYRGSSSNISEQIALQQQLEQSQKMEAVGQLTGGVAHDFNNLLNIIQGNAEILQENIELGIAPDLRLLDRILRATGRGAELTQRMLAFSRKQDLKPQTLHLNKELASVVDILKRTIRADIELVINLAEDLWPCTADLGQVENALLNLTLNARDAMPKGGMLTIEASNAHLIPSEISPDNDSKSTDYVLLTVTDTGEGISQSELSKVFEPFYTTKEVGKGTGLGLSMVYGFAQQSNGHASISSEPGIGTTVKLYLPRA